MLRQKASLLALGFVIVSGMVFSCLPYLFAGGSIQGGADWTIDGKLEEPFWKSASTLQFVPAVDGVPSDLGGTAQVVTRGNHLSFGAFLPEPGGKVQARSIGYNPTWEKYALTSPAVEDRVTFRIEDNPGSDIQSILEVTLNPWGAMRVERDGVLVSQSEILRAAEITSSGWSVELAIPLQELSQLGIPENVQFSAERLRSPRPQAPEFRWGSSERTLMVTNPQSPAESAKPRYAPAAIGNQDPPLEVGRVQKVPALNIPWDDPFWGNIAGFELPRNEPHPRPAEYPTIVKWVHDGEMLQVFFRNMEDGRLDVDVDTRDGNVASDDHVGIYLALSGSSTLEILANPVGAVRDARSSGPRAYGSSTGAFDASIKGNFVKEKGRWMVRLNLPLKELAVALGESSVPARWKILVARVRQERPGEPAETSTLPVLENPFLNAPARFRDLVLSELPPSQISVPQSLVSRQPKNIAEGRLRESSPYALSRVQRKYHDVTNMMQNWIDQRTETLAMEEHSEWDQVENLQDWEAFREKRMPVVREALGDFPTQRCDLNFQITGTYQGDGYRIRNIAYQSRLGFYVAANLYLPDEPLPKMPAMIILPAHHYPKTHGEMKDCGMIWARTGVAVLIMEHIGYGERLETSPLYRQSYESEYLLSTQLELVGQSYQGWIVYDIMRTVDLFEEMGNIDLDRVILIGSVTSGGGRRAAPAGLLDSRIDAQIIYNFGRVYWYGWGTRNMINNRITPWFIVNAFAPKRLVYAHEFWYEGEEGPVYPSVWVPAWPRYEKVYQLYGAAANLANVQGEGLLRAEATEFIPRGDCYMIGTVQRQSLYPILKEWFDIPFPSEKDQNMPKDSSLSDVRGTPDYPVIEYMESLRRPSDEDILSLPPSASETLKRRPLHAIAAEMGEALLAKARQARESMTQEGRGEVLRQELARVLGDIETESEPKVTELWEETHPELVIEALVVETEEAILVPFFLLKPKDSDGDRLPLVLALAEGGKSRFIRELPAELLELVAQGYSICIPDVRGTGETAPSQYNRSGGLALSMIELGTTLLGARLKDVRTVLEYLKTRPDIDEERISLWGDSFAPINTEPIWVDESGGKPVGPRIQHFASPLGAHLSLLTALYHPEVQAVAVRGSLVGYLSVLDDPFVYIPPDMMVPKLLEVADIADIAASLSPTPLLVSAPVTGRNFLAGEAEIAQELQLVVAAYGPQEELSLEVRHQTVDIVQWLAR